MAKEQSKDIDIKKVEEELDNFELEKRLPYWVELVINDFVATEPTKADLARKYNKSRSTVSKYLNRPDVKKLIELKKQSVLGQTREKLKSLAPRAAYVLEKVLGDKELKDGKKIDKSTIDVAVTLLKGLNALNEKNFTEHTGGIQIVLPEQAQQDYTEDE